MKIYLNGKDIKNLMLFTSKNKARKYLSGINIKEVSGFVEIVATDGAALMMYRRKLDPGEELAPNSSIILKMPKLKIKEKFLLEEVAKGVFSISSLYEKSYCEVMQATYPNYNAIMPSDLSKLPLASEFTIFRSKLLKKLEAVFFVPGRPKANNANTPHFWEKHENGADYLVVLMPCRI